MEMNAETLGWIGAGVIVAFMLWRVLRKKAPSAQGGKRTGKYKKE